MMSSSTSPNKDDERMIDNVRSLENFLNSIQPKTNLSEMMNLKLTDNSALTSNFLNQRVKAGTSSSSKHQCLTFNEINNSIETIDDYSSPSKSSPGSLIQQTAASFYDDNKEEDEDTDVEKNVTKLFVGNLPFGTTLAELLPVFKKFGPVDDKLSAVKHRDHYAFINFYNRNDAQMALQEVNNSLFKDRYLRVQFSHSKQQFKSPSNRDQDKSKHESLDIQSKSFQQSVASSSSFSSRLNEAASSFVPSSSFHHTTNATSSPDNKAPCRPITGNRLNHSQSFSFSSSSSSHSPTSLTRHLSLRSLNQIRNSLIDKILLNEYNQSNFQREQILKEIRKIELQIELVTQQQQQQQNILSFNQRVIQQQLQQHLKPSQTQQQTGSRLFQQQINRTFNPRKSTSTMPKSNTIGNFANNDQLCRMLSQSKQANYLSQQHSGGVSSGSIGKSSFNQYNLDK